MPVTTQGTALQSSPGKNLSSGMITLPEFFKHEKNLEIMHNKLAIYDKTITMRSPH